MKKMIRLVLGICMLLGMTGCNSSSTVEREVITDERELQVMVATDLHYISSELTDNGAGFTELLLRGDGKLTDYSTEIADRLCELAIEKKPDALIITGDLTFNGELKSLQDLRKKLQQVQETGVPVLVIPGNHDINYSMAYSYLGYTAYKEENISQAQFKSLMKEFGYNDAILQDDCSFSYLYPLSTSQYLLAIDCNTEDNPGTVSDATLAWIEQALEKAKEDGANVVSFTHQNILSPSAMFSSGFVINNNDEVRELLQKYGVTLNLSGHSHLQHTGEQDGFTDIITESASVYPLRYSNLYLNGDQFDYVKDDLGILYEESEERFDACTGRQMDEVLESVDATEEEKEIMRAFAIEVNKLYFTGEDMDKESLKNDPGYVLWAEKGSGTFWGMYLQGMIG